MPCGGAAQSREPRREAVSAGSGSPSSAGQDLGGTEPGGGQGSAVISGRAADLHAYRLSHSHASLGRRRGRLAGAGGAEFRGPRGRPDSGLSAADRPVPAARREPGAAGGAPAHALTDGRDVGAGDCPGIRLNIEGPLMAKPRASKKHLVRGERAPLTSPYEGLALLADPIHRYIVFTVPKGERSERTEKDIIHKIGRTHL